MKRFLVLTILGMMGALVQMNAHATEIESEKDIEVEAAAADLYGTDANAGFLNQQAENEKLKTELSAAAATKAVRVAKSQQRKEESQIGAAEAEIRTLKAQQQQWQARRQQILKERIAVRRKLVATVQLLKTYRAQVQREHVLAAREEQALRAEKMRLARLQKSLPVVRKTAAVKKPVRTASAKDATQFRR